MSIDPELMKQLIVTFKAELEEQAQQITDGLLKLEKGFESDDEKLKIIETIFRSAHNIKGASRGIGIHDVGEIAHCIESLFNKMKNNKLNSRSDIIDICLEAVDKMPIALNAFVEQSSLPFDLTDLLNRLGADDHQKPDMKTTSSIVIEKKQASPDPDPHESIRVSIGKIDKVFALLEEIQINKIAIEDHYKALSHIILKTKELSTLWKQIFTGMKSNKQVERNDFVEKLYDKANDCFMEMSFSADYLQKTMRSQLNELSILSNSLQEEVRLLRLIPASNLIRSLPRYARDLAKELNKEIELEIQGDEVRMDQLVLERLKDPLIHLIRNAIDHGIESPDVRQAIGKSKVGHIKISVIDEGNNILINISDDGSGIDINKISSFIEEKKLATPADLAKMNKNEILEFIFRSGFSTKNTITNVSGRGVGLDVVKANLTELKGNVSVTTEFGQGTTFCLTVPLTLSSERGLLVNCHDQLFVIPTNTIKRVLMVRANDIVDVEGSQALLVDEHPVPLRILSDVLGLMGKEILEKEKLSIVVVEKGWHSVAFLVDDIVGEREIVIKPLRSPLAHVSCVSGGTLLEHNQVAIVLQSTDLLNKALNVTSVRRIASEDASEKTKDKPHILVVDDSITTRTLEKNILESKDYQVTITVNGKEAWDLLQKQKFSLLITDVSMPIMDGFTLTENVKKSEKLRDLPVIIVTSLGSDAEKARGVEAGADAYIVKNEFESGALLDIVEQLV